MNQDDEGLIDLSDMTFDFDDYFKRFDEKTLTQEEFEEFSARVMGLFCREFIEHRAVPHWVMNYMCEQMYKVLGGEEWAHAFPLPWTTETPIRSRSDQLALEMFCDIANQLKADPTAKVTTVIASVASTRNVSYELARAGYYKYVKHLSKDFLKRDEKI